MSQYRALRSQQRQLMRWWGGLALSTTLLALLISVRYFAVADLDASAGSVLFRIVMLIGHLGLCSLLLLTPVLLLAWVWPRPRWVIPFGVLCSVAVLLTLLIDTQVYQLYRFHINAGVLNLLFGGAARETFMFSSGMYAQAVGIAAGALLLLSGLAAALWRSVQRTTGRATAMRPVAGVLVACLVSFHAIHIWADALAYEPVLEQTSVLPLRYAATAKRFLRAQGVEVRTGPAIELAGRIDRSNLSYPLRPLNCRSAARPPNIVFVVIDSWRFDALDARITPHIAAFSAGAVRFSDHHSGGNATRIGMFSLFYSIPGTYWHQMLNERRGPVFVNELLRQNYDVQVFRSAPLFSPEFDRTIFAETPSPRMRSQGEGPADWDQDLTEDFLAFLDARSGAAPFFALLFYDSPHSFETPRRYPRVFEPSASEVNYLQLGADSDQRPIVNRYRNSVHFVDSLVGRVLESMRTRGLLENTIIVITGDHGQEFNDNGRNFWGHGSNFTRYQTGVPLLWFAPGVEPGVVNHRTTHFDVAPTLMRDHLGCEAPLRAYSVGRPLFQAGGREPLLLSEYADFAIVQRDRIAVVREYGLQMFSLDYAKLDAAPDPASTRAALEQKTRFFKPLSKTDAG